MSTCTRITLGNARRFLPAMVIAALLLLWAPVSLLAQCAPQQAPFVFLHPFFANQRWRTDAPVVIDPALCGRVPLAAAFTADPDLAAGVLVNGDFTLDLLTSYTDYPAGLCGPRTLIIDPPQRLPFAFSGTTIPAALATASEDSVAIASLNANRVLVRHMHQFTLGIGSVDTLRPTLSGGAALSIISGNALVSGLWVGGSRGVIRHFARTTNSWSAEQVFDIDQAETITSLGGGYCATQSGKIYRFAANAFELIGTVAIGPIRYLSAYGGVGDNGAAFRFEQGVPVPFSAGTANLRAFQITPSAQGALTSLLGSNWSLTTTQPLPRQPGTIVSVTPEHISPFLLSKQPYILTSPMQATLMLHEPDAQPRVPQVTFRTDSLAPFRARARISYNDSLLDFDPERVSEVGISEITGDSITLDFSHESVSMTVQARTGSYLVPCNSTIWQPVAHTIDWLWSIGEAARIVVGHDTLTFVNGDHATVNSELVAKPAKVPAISVLRTGALLHIKAPGTLLQQVAVHTLDGRRVAITQITRHSDGLSCRLDNGAHSTLIVTITSGSGMRQSFTVSNRR